MSKLIVCSGCGKTRPKAGHDLCKRCYARRLVVCFECGEKKRLRARGLCPDCYQRSCRKSKPLVVCTGCGTPPPLVACGLCETCYLREYPKSMPLIVCADCGKKRPHAAHGLCKTCFEKTRISECTRCGETKRRAARGLCHRCYRHVYKDPGIVERMAAREAEDDRKGASLRSTASRRRSRTAATPMQDMPQAISSCPKTPRAGSLSSVTLSATTITPTVGRPEAQPGGSPKC